MSQVTNPIHVIINHCVQEAEYFNIFSAVISRFILGTPDFTSASVKLLLGEDSVAITDGRALGIQCLSGTGALRMGAEFLVRQMGRSVFYYSNPTWDNHHRIFMHAGFKEAREYRYWDPVNRNIDFVGFKEDLEAAPEGAVILLHACAHNPTGRCVGLSICFVVSYN